MNSVLSKLIPFCLIPFCVLFLFCFKVQAVNYYFSDKIGNDSRSPSQAQNPDTPWKSIHKLNDFFTNLNPGDKVYFRRGDVFYGSILISKGGSSGSPITFGAYGSGADPIITSLVSLSNWKSVGSGIYESSDNDLPDGEINMVLVNNSVQEMGRYPNSNTSEKGYLTYDSHSGKTSITDNDLSSSPNWTGGEVVLRKLYWITDRHKITNHSGSKITYGSNPDTQYEPRNGYGYFIQNHPLTLDRYGEWYYDKNKKAVRVYFGSNPGSSEVEASTFDHLVTNRAAANFITFEHLHFKGANKNAFYLEGGNSLKILNCKIEFSGENGIHIAGIPHLVVEGSKVLWSNNMGMNIKSSDNVTIRNNIVNDTYLYPGHGRSGNNNGLSILSTGNSNIIESNEIKRSGYIGIRFGGNNTEVKNNFIDGFCLTKNDGAGIYSYSNKDGNNKNRKVTNNIILNGKGVVEGTLLNLLLSNAQAEGIYMDDNVNDVEISGNTVAHMSSKGIYLHNTKNVRVRNNNVYDAEYLIFLRNDNMGNPLENNRIEGNNLMTKDAFQNFLQIYTHFDDVSKLADFNNNNFSAPLSDNIRFHIKYNAGSSNEINRILGLDGWQGKFGKDLNSNIGSPAEVKYYVKNEIEKNRYDNGTFENNVNYVSCSDCTHSWDKDKLDDGTLKVSTKGSSQIAITIGELEKGKTYRMKFSGIGNQTIPISSFLRQASSPYQQVSSDQNFSLTTKRREIEVIYKAVENVKSARFVMEVATGDASEIWIDNFEFQEVESELVKPEDKIFFKYNAKNSKASINTAGGFVNLLGQALSTTNISLDPYASVLLIKSTEGAIEIPDSSPEITITSPTHNEEINDDKSILIQTEVTIPNGEISKVDFYNNNNKLGSSYSEPYNFLWEKAPPGNHSLRAVAVAENGEETTSESITLVMKSIEISEKEESSSYFINIGSTGSTSLDQMTFSGEDGDNQFYNSSKTYLNEKASNYPLFQTERHGAQLNYEIPVSNGVYYVYTFHNELYFGHNGPSSKAGNRVFNISMENEIVKDELDPFVENKNKPFVLSFGDIKVQDGILNIDFLAFSNNASISGIIISKTPVSIPGSLLPNLPYSPTSPEDKDDLFADHILVNAGSPNNVIYDNRTFTGDENPNYFINSTTYTNLSASKEPLYQTERFGKDLRIKIPLKNGTYTVKTYHNELWFGSQGPASAIGNRVFDISIEGKTLKRNFDIFVENKNQPMTLTFENVTVQDGLMDIQFEASENNATISGIFISESGTMMPGPNEPSPSPTDQKAIFINAGTYDKVTYSNNDFKGDQNFDFHNDGSRINFNLSVEGNQLFLTERYGSRINYDIPLENGTYTVVTYHNELWFGSYGPPAKSGNRVFSINLEGKRVKSNIDLYIENKNNPLSLTFEDIKVEDGILDLDLTAIVNNVTISGLAIIPQNNSNGANLRAISGPEMFEAEVFHQSEINLGPRFTIYPNPASGQTTLNLAKDLSVKEIFLQSSNGTLVKRINPTLVSDGFGSFTIPLERIKAGVYILTLTDGKNWIEKVKLIVN